MKLTEFDRVTNVWSSMIVVILNQIIYYRKHCFLYSGLIYLSSLCI